MLKRIWTFLVVLLALSVALVACNKIEPPEQAVTNALNAVKNLDKDTIQKYFDSGELLDSEDWVKDDESIRLLFDQLQFKIISSSKEGNAATVKTLITNTDMAVIMEEYFEKILELSFNNALPEDDEESDKAMEQLLIDLLKRDNNEKATSTVDIKLARHQDSWVIEPTEEFQDAVTGGLYSTIIAMDESFSEEDTPESILSEINDFVMYDVWEDGFLEISQYLLYGEDSNGEGLEIDYTLEWLADVVEVKAEYDDYMKSLEDKKYATVKQIWSKLSAEIDRLYNQVVENKPVAGDSSYQFDTGVFEQYMAAFGSEVEKLNADSNADTDSQ